MTKIGSHDQKMMKFLISNLSPYSWPGSLREHCGEFTAPVGPIDHLMVRSTLLVSAPPRANNAPAHFFHPKIRNFVSAMVNAIRLGSNKIWKFPMPWWSEANGKRALRSIIGWIFVTKVRSHDQKMMKISIFNLRPYSWPGSLREHCGEFTAPLGFIYYLMVRSTLLGFAPPRANDAPAPFFDPRIQKFCFRHGQRYSSRK